MDKAYQRELLAAATRLIERAKTDRALAARLKSDPGKAITEEAGRPLPQGVRVVAELAADAKSFHLKPVIEPSFKGELDEKVLDAVAGGDSGKGGGSGGGQSPGQVIIT